MDEATEPANAAAPADASEWFVALAERPDDTLLRARFEAWLAASPSHAADWAEILHTAAVVRSARPASPQPWEAFAAERRARRAADDKEVVSPISARGRNRRPRRWPQLLAVAACLVLFFGSDLMTWFRADYSTGAAPSGEVRLADGSTVRLAPRSAIDVAGARRVRLLKGEAFFEVVHDAREPFVVEVRDLLVRDLGTAFDVRLAVEATDVAVRDGLVEVKPARESPAFQERLLPGDWLRVSSTGQTERGHMPIDDVAAWTRGHLIVKNRPVFEVVDAIRPYFTGLIVLRGEQLSGQPLTGVYDLGDPLAALNAVARAQGATVRQISPWILVISGS